VRHFRPLFPATQKVVRAFALGLKAMAFIAGSQAILQVRQVRPEIRQSPETDAVCDRFLTMTDG
jgi:hypothetical protein